MLKLLIMSLLWFRVVWCKRIYRADLPEFAEEMENVTVPIGRDAIFTCVVNNLGSYKVAWVRVDTQTILTIDDFVITRNPRVRVSVSDVRRSWSLLLRDVQLKEAGGYMCQVNTVPMMSQTAWLRVAVPPDIIDAESSTDQLVSEGSNVTLRCSAVGEPKPQVTWRREDGKPLLLPMHSYSHPLSQVDGAALDLVRVNRQHMGAYLCLASNGIPPTVSKRILLRIQFPPMTLVPNQLVGAREGDSVTLDCHCESFPRPVTYWVKDSGEIVSPGSRFQVETSETGYKAYMKLKIGSLMRSDFETYVCICKNPLGVSESAVRLYQIPQVTRESPIDNEVTNTDYEELPNENVEPEYDESNKQRKQTPRRNPPHSRPVAGNEARINSRSMFSIFMFILLGHTMIQTIL